MDILKLFFRYFISACIKRKALALLFTLFSVITCAIGFFELKPNTQTKIFICIFLFLILLIIVLVQTSILSITDANAPKIKKTFCSALYKNKFDITFLAEKPLCSRLFDIGTCLSLVKKSNGIEEVIGSGIIFNIQSNGMLQVGFNLISTYQQSKDEIERDFSNIYFIPYKDLGALYEA